MATPLPPFAPAGLDNGTVSAPAQLSRALILLFAAWLIWRTAWVSDDAAITLRTVLNLLTGHGARFNVAERVQAYTHPLWFGLTTVGTWLTGNAFTAVAWLGIVCSIVALAWLMRLAVTPWQGLLTVAALLCSDAFVQFATAGLENPLSHLLLIGGATALVRFYAAHGDSVRRARALRGFYLCAGLLYLNRPDLVLMLAPAGLQLLVNPSLPRSTRWRALLWAVVPVAAWTAFSLFYYGYPFPNTAYAKLGTGIERAELFAQGWHYFENSLSRDPITLIVAALALLLAPCVRGWGWAWGLGTALYLAYVASIGGDFMAGRFFTAPMLAGAVVLAVGRFKPVSLLFATIGVALLGWPGLATTLELALTRQTTAEQVRDASAIADERSFYYRTYALANLTDADHARFRPDRWQGGVQGTATLCGGLGYFSIRQGPLTHSIDSCALADPLLARLPMPKGVRWYPGHFERPLPVGYEDSVTRQVNVLADPVLHALYERIRRITRAPLLDSQRLKDIVWINTARLRRGVDLAR